jgi:hypothetical protein
MYTTINFRTKSELIESFREGVWISVYQPGNMFPGQRDGWATLEGPHYPKPHTWYARVVLKNGFISRIH